MADTLTLDDIERSNTRRRWLKALAAVAAVGGGGWFLFSDTDVRPTEVSVVLAPGLESLSWSGETLEVTFEGETDADQWFILHESEEQPTAAVANGEVTPGETVTVRAREMRSRGYPTPRFRLLLVNLDTGEGQNSYDAERVASVEFSLP